MNNQNIDISKISPEAISKCSQRHIQSVLEDLIELALKQENELIELKFKDILNNC